MKTYWFYLEPYTFLFQKGDNVLLYNTFSGKSVAVKIDPDIKPILDAWDNLYCAEISELQLKNNKIGLLIKRVQNSFSGDFIEIKPGYGRPVVLKPILNFQKKNERLVSDGFSIGDNVLKHLSSLTLYLNGKCNRNCQYCDKYFKQFACCTITDKTLSIKNIENILNFVIDNNFAQLHILGGDLSSILNITDFVSLFDKLPAKKNYYSNLLNVNLNIINIIKNNTLKILCIFPFDMDYFVKIFNLIMSNNIKTQWVFIITSEKEYFEAEHIIGTLNLKDTAIKPFYTGNNSTFFRKNIYLNHDDINDIKLNKRQIFANQCININEFGRITIFSDGQVYGNTNFPPLGKIGDDFRKLVYNELTNGVSWFHIRDQAPCNKCVYQWLCPSPSNYEIAIGQPNLCHVWKEDDKTGRQTNK